MVNDFGGARDGTGGSLTPALALMKPEAITPAVLFLLAEGAPPGLTRQSIADQKPPYF